MFRSMIIVAALACAGGALAQTPAKTAFDTLSCEQDVATVLKGRKGLSGTISALEKRYASLSLKHLGADNISRNMNTIFWRICGKEYMVLEQADVVRDVVEFPAHDRASPAFTGTCRINGRNSDEYYAGVLNAAGVSGNMLPAKAVWLIDRKKARLVSVEAKTASCERSGIFTVDGGL